MLQIGRFDKFKGARTVLLTGTGEEIASLSKQLAQVVAASGDSLPLHEIALVAPSHPLRLFAVRAIPNDGEKDAAYWPCDAAVIDKLISLAATGAGHQYFDIAGPETTLLASVGEYDANWWQKNG